MLREEVRRLALDGSMVLAGRRHADRLAVDKVPAPVPLPGLRQPALELGDGHAVRNAKGIAHGKQHSRAYGERNLLPRGVFAFGRRLDPMPRCRR